MWLHGATLRFEETRRAVEAVGIATGFGTAQLAALVGTRCMHSIVLDVAFGAVIVSMLLAQCWYGSRR
jgi:hypothetical protein